MRAALLTGMIILACASLSREAAAFTVRECVLGLSGPNIIAKYRLSPAAATRRCAEIGRRVTMLANQIVGRWTRRQEGHVAILDFRRDGSVMAHSYNYINGRMEDTVETWSADNPYGAIGQEGLEFRGTHSTVTFRGRMMTITSRPASADVVERWSRAN